MKLLSKLWFMFFCMTLALSGVTASGLTLSGKVYGGSTALVGAVATLANASTGSSMGVVTTDAAGNYSFQVGAGTYNLAINPPKGAGFVSGNIKAINISVSIR